jgi:hypothetical protein
MMNTGYYIPYPVIMKQTSSQQSLSTVGSNCVFLGGAEQLEALLSAEYSKAWMWRSHPCRSLNIILVRQPCGWETDASDRIE